MCVSGWEGWGCTDNSEAYSYSFQLLSTLLLCLSNLMFVPPVAIAVRSHYLLEASVYIFTMFFSTVSDWQPRVPPGLRPISAVCCVLLDHWQPCIHHRPGSKVILPNVLLIVQLCKHTQLCNTEAGTDGNTKWLQTVNLVIIS